MTKTTIFNLTVEIEPNEDRDGVNCYISKGKFSGSLSALEDNGVLTWIDEEMPVSTDAIDRIRAYAEKHGY